MIGKKTATLIKASCVAGCLAANATEDATDALAGYGWKIGLGFQVADDFLDTFGEKTGKEKGKDIIEHKLGNAVIISALEELGDSKARDLLAILRSSRVSASKLKEAMELIERTNAKTRTYRLAEKLVNEGKAKLKILPESSAKTALIQLADFIATRVY
jgi:geranylgeranyl diphosphate synthase type I